jgi:hypothetical protein
LRLFSGCGKRIAYLSINKGNLIGCPGTASDLSPLWLNLYNILDAMPVKGEADPAADTVRGSEPH